MSLTQDLRGASPCKTALAPSPGTGQRSVAKATMSKSLLFIKGYQQRANSGAKGSASPLKALVLRRARELGFDLVGITTAEPLVDQTNLTVERIRLGYMEGMPWFSEERVQRAGNPQELLPDARSIVVVGLSYLPPEETIPSPVTGEGEDGGGDAGSSRSDGLQRESSAPTGKVARYARWTDYHGIMKEKLHILAAELPHLAGRPVRCRVFVDDSPLLERAVAQRAGLGWWGKNTNVLTPTHGSWVFLGALVTDLELEPDEPLKKSCGDCVRCIPACPTGAIVSPYVLDARRCISFLTIECRGPIPGHLRPLVGDWVFGCDVCQEVCPVNREVPAARMPELKRSGFDALELAPLLSMSQQEFSAKFRNTPIKRARLAGLQRNACVALGNIGDLRAVPALGSVLGEAQPLVRGHAAWALGRIGGRQALQLLEHALEQETDLEVREEIESALIWAKARPGGDP